MRNRVTESSAGWLVPNYYAKRRCNVPAMYAGIAQVASGERTAEEVIDAIVENSGWVETTYKTLDAALKASVLGRMHKRNWKIEKRTASYVLASNAWGSKKEFKLAANASGDIVVWSRAVD